MTVITVNGEIESDQLGRTLCHEHLYLNAEPLKVSTPSCTTDNSNRSLDDLSNLGWLRYFPYSHPQNLIVETPSILEKELQYYKEAGGKTIVDVTVVGLRPSLQDYPLKLAELSTKTGIHIVCGTGFYVDKSHPDFVKHSSADELADFLVNEIQSGIQGTSVRAGVIGEIGCSWPLSDNEKKTLKASAIAQQRTGAPLIIHPGRDEKAPIEIVNLLREYGADISHTVMSHLDRTIFEDSSWDELASTGIYLELDLFGIEVSYYQQKPTMHMPHDGQRIDRVLYLVKRGYLKQVLLSHDIHTNHRLISFGGHGYSHIFSLIVPRLLDAGLSQEQIDTIIIRNPAEWLCTKNTQ